MNECRPCLIGQVFIDFVETERSEPTLRLGGIMHAARAFWAMDVPFGLAFIAPEYLKQDAEEHASRSHALSVQHIGKISRCPNVIFVGEGKEIGSQRYEYLLREQSVCDLYTDAFKKMVDAGDFTDFLLFPGGFPLPSVLEQLSGSTARIHADINFIEGDVEQLRGLRRKFSSLIVSTSSDLFLAGYRGSVSNLVSGLGNFAETVLLKENRGGSRLFKPGNSAWDGAPAQVRPILHSVGVGDFFDAVFVAQEPRYGGSAALSYASFAAAEYASCLDDGIVRESTLAILKIAPDQIQELGGVTLPWESRKNIDVYLAAPDFDHVNTAPLDALARALEYHNFSPHRPVREHGQARADSSAADKLRLAEADLGLLARCKLLVAVLLYDDPGTLIEIGIAFEKNMPVIVFDPFERASNLILTELPTLVSSDLDQVIAEVFVQAAKIANEKR